MYFAECNGIQSLYITINTITHKSHNTKYYLFVVVDASKRGHQGITPIFQESAHITI